MDIALQNGAQKVTVIENFRGNCLIVYPGFRKEFRTLEDAKHFVLRKKWEINISFIKGSKVARELIETQKIKEAMT